MALWPSTRQEDRCHEGEKDRLQGVEDKADGDEQEDSQKDEDQLRVARTYAFPERGLYPYLYTGPMPEAGRLGIGTSRLHVRAFSRLKSCVARKGEVDDYPSPTLHRKRIQRSGIW